MVYVGNEIKMTSVSMFILPYAVQNDVCLAVSGVMEQIGGDIPFRHPYPVVTMQT